MCFKELRFKKVSFLDVKGGGWISSCTCDVCTHIREQLKTNAWERRTGNTLILSDSAGRTKAAQGQGRLEVFRPRALAPSLPPPPRAQHVPRETVDLLHVEATGGAVS